MSKVRLAKLQGANRARFRGNRQLFSRTLYLAKTSAAAAVRIIARMAVIGRAGTVLYQADPMSTPGIEPIKRIS